MRGGGRPRRRRGVCALVAGGGYELAPRQSANASQPEAERRRAASLPETFFTVWSNVFDRAHLKRGETLVVHGGSSGIGVTAIQLAKAWGARVITTVGSAEKAAACRALGADHAIDYKTQDFVAEVLRLTGGAGADVVLDMVAGDYIARRRAVPRRGWPHRHHRGAGRNERPSTPASCCAGA
jgi:NADPH2:quinone reductase